MSSTVFFSWQSDTPNKSGRSFLKEVLEDVCKELAADTSLDEAFRDLGVDHDTQGVAGQPPIADTIFKKIDSAAVFVGDMTLTNKRENGEKSPNPNVLIEYGWALKSLSFNRVIWVMNSAYGDPLKEGLPFDLKHIRRPIVYSLPADASRDDRAAEKRKLLKILREAIGLSLKTVPESQTFISPVFSSAVSKDGPARFRSPGEPLGISEGNPFVGVQNRKIFLGSGPAIWLRLFPASVLKNELRVPELMPVVMNNSSLFPTLMHGYAGLSFIRASDGVGIFNDVTERTQSATTESVAFIFKTGEIWSIDTSALRFMPGVINTASLENMLATRLESYSEFLTKLGFEPSFSWKAGIIGAEGRSLTYPPPHGHQWVPGYNGPLCVTDLIEGEGVFEVGQPSMTSLLPFFEKIFAESGKLRPDYLGR